MEDLCLVTESHSFEDLVHEVLYSFHWDVLVLEAVDVMLQVLVAVLEDQDKSLLVVDDVVQPRNAEPTSRR